MKGLQTWRNVGNQFAVVRLHYSADPEKNEAWKERTRRGMPTESWEQEYEINFEQHAGQAVYPGFRREQHVKELNWNPDLSMIRGWDFGFRHPAVVFAQMDVNDRLLLLREMLGTNILIHRFADEVLERSEEWFPDAKWKDYCDPAGTQASDKSEHSSIEVLERKHMVPEYRQEELQAGLNTIRFHLLPREDGIPSILVDPACSITIEGFQGGYHFPDARDGRPDSDVPEKDGYFDHLMDAVRYVAIHVLPLAEKEPPPPSPPPNTIMDRV